MPSIPFVRIVRDHLVLLAVVLAATGCASFQPVPAVDGDFATRAQTQSVGGVTVSAAVLSAEESERVFGLSLATKGIQPVWLRIENRSEFTYLFVPAGLDPDYFSPQEVAWANRTRYSAEARRTLETDLDRKTIRTYFPPGATAQGFVHTTLDEGVKYVSAQLFRIGGRQQFDFVFDVPGFHADYHRVDFDVVVPASSHQAVRQDQLRALLAELPCCVLGPDGETPGDPLNIVVIGRGAKAFVPFARRGWDATETMSGDSVWRTIYSSLFGSRYETSPVSPLFFNGRQQDIALQKARGTVDERNHLRLWATPYRLDGNGVWIGQISRDIGVRLSAKTLVTHKIDPDVDEARDYLLQDLLLSGNLKRFGYVTGVGLAPPDAPRYNYTRDPYFTDGLRVVLFLDEQYVSADRLEMLDWESPVEMTRDDLGRPIGAEPETSP